MTTHSAISTDIQVPHARKSTDGRTMDASDSVAPQLKERFNRLVENSKDRVGEWRDGFQGGVREKPIQSILIASAVGIFVGLLLGRRG